MKIISNLCHEVHTESGNGLWNPHWKNGCECNFCKGDSKRHFGLNIPKSKSPNSWWTIKYWNARYIRFTLPWLGKSTFSFSGKK